MSMEPQYTAQRIEDTTTGWLVVEVETGKKHVVFCNADANTAEDAVALLTEEPTGDEETTQ